MIPLILSAFVAYILGAIPFSYMAGKLAMGIDLREHGSGNLGASNAFRLLGPKIACLVLIGDVAKGYLPVILAPVLFTPTTISPHWMMLCAAFFAVIGHMYSVFLRFSGGKGIATSAGAFLALSPWAFLGSLIVWLTLLGITRIVSVASLAGALTLPIFVYLAGRTGHASTHHWSLITISCIVALVVIVRHKSNIKRLLAGEEPALSRRKP